MTRYQLTEKTSAFFTVNGRWQDVYPHPRGYVEVSDNKVRLVGWGQTIWRAGIDGYDFGELFEFEARDIEIRDEGGYVTVSFTILPQGYAFTITCLQRNRQ